MSERILSFNHVNPHDALVDDQDEDIGEPEENRDQGHIHVVVVTIIDKPTIRIFQKDEPINS